MRELEEVFFFLIMAIAQAAGTLEVCRWCDGAGHYVDGAGCEC